MLKAIPMRNGFKLAQETNALNPRVSVNPLLRAWQIRISSQRVATPRRFVRFRVSQFRNRNQEASVEAINFRRVFRRCWPTFARGRWESDNLGSLRALCMYAPQKCVAQNCNGNSAVINSIFNPMWILIQRTKVDMEREINWKLARLKYSEGVEIRYYITRVAQNVIHH